MTLKRERQGSRGSGPADALRDELTQWLDQLGLGHLADLLIAHEVTVDLLPSLTDGDLKEVGLPLGARRIILGKLATRDSDDRQQGHFRSLQRQATAERRQLTLLFCDLADSTALSTRLDPEDLGEIINAYQQACSLPIKLFDGHIARYVGDGILVYFGYPVAHADDAERAVRAGLGIVDAIAKLNARIGAGKNVQLGVRVGIATGLVVVGDIIGENSVEKDAVVGLAPNLAARLQGLAQPGSVVVSDVTRQLARSFNYTSLGEQVLKGIDGPTMVWRVDGETFASRLEARGATVARFINREAHTAVLLGRWRRGATGEGQVAVLTGEAGIGKSRLAAEVVHQISKSARETGAPLPTVLRIQCSSFHSNAPLFPVARLVEHIAGLDRHEPEESKLRKVGELLAHSGLISTADLAAIASLCQVTTYWERSDELREGRQRMLDALHAWFRALAAKGPLLIVIEDCHWIDPTSRLMLHQLIDFARSAPLFLIATMRGGPGSDGRDAEAERLVPPAPHVTHLTLGPLDPESTTRLVEEISGKPLPAELTNIVMQKSERIPLFVEELTIGLLDAGVHVDPMRESDRLSPLTVPNTLNEALMARLDQTGSAKAIAQQAAVIGREFSVNLLATLTGIPMGPLVDQLRILEAASLISRDPARGDVYSFRHALTRDVAYRSLLRKTRRELHLMLAAEFSVNSATQADVTDDRIAQHFAAGGALAEAIRWWARAAKEAIANSAHEEAANMLREAFGVLQAQGAAAAIETELDLTLLLATAQRSLHGYAFPEVERLILRARELYTTVGPSTSRFGIDLLARGHNPRAAPRACRSMSPAPDRGAGCHDR